MRITCPTSHMIASSILLNTLTTFGTFFNCQFMKVHTIFTALYSLVWVFAKYTVFYPTKGTTEFISWIFCWKYLKTIWSVASMVLCAASGIFKHQFLADPIETVFINNITDIYIADFCFTLIVVWAFDTFFHTHRSFNDVLIQAMLTKLMLTIHKEIGLCERITTNFTHLSAFFWTIYFRLYFLQGL